MANADGVDVPADLQRTVAARVREVGLSSAAEELGLARETTARVAAGARVRQGTLLVIRQALKKKRD